ncbi:LacI family DNA-binding transcriptional regulator [Gulosibacter sp. 10]|uniref:LacI family DNA-binding transcriptional regulator n=1 Tax=Gulosibacter sp. 10 TaxID=1255570 RepID=UPI00097F6A6B|nr:LacI family DNA-binding transcriptional regulator [Gulosibacter sp. 10]SJM56483.1 Ribose operon repressor [Gulosibacter sp. 10]
MPSDDTPQSRRTVTMADVAKAAGVSRQLVSLVIRNQGYVAPGKRALVLETAERLGYRRNHLAAGLAGQRTFALGMVTLDIHNQVYADFAEGIARVTAPAGYQLLLAVGGPDEESRRKNIDSLVGLRVDGLLVADHSSAGLEIQELLTSTPCVSLGEVSSSERVDSVAGDDRLGARLATEHLIDQGHRRIAYIAGPVTQQNSARRGGYRHAMFSASLAPFELDGDASEAAGAAALTHMSETGTLPTAVVSYNDSTAIGVLARAQELGLRVPEDLAVTGYDNTRGAGYPGVELTSVDQRSKRIGAEAAALLLERIAQPDKQGRTVVLEPELVVRRSSLRPAT